MADNEERIGNATTNATSIEAILEEDDIYWTPRTRDNVIFFAIIGVGLLAHVLIVHTIFKSKRLRSRTNVIIMNWIIFELISHNIVYPVLYYWHVYQYSFVLHIIMSNVLLVMLLSSIFCLNLLLSDAIMLADHASFNKFIERFYGVLLATFVFDMFWKLFTAYGIYMEILLAIAFLLNAFVLVVRVAWKQCYRVVKCQQLNPNAELRLHVATLYLVSKLCMIALNVASVAYKYPVLMYLSKFWSLSGFYVIVLLMVKDVNFKISLCEVLGIHRKHPNDVAHMIEECDEQIAETCIENA